MNIYDVNKGIYQNVPPMKSSNVKKVMFDYFSQCNSHYFLMLNHDIHYYTLFHSANSFSPENMTKEVYSIVKELGPVVDIINNQETAMLEIWIKYDGQSMMFGLFDYERGVVEV